MLSLKPSILHKALILLAVPLIFETIVATTLLCLQRYYCESVKAESTRKLIVFCTNDLWYHNASVMTNCLASALLSHERWRNHRMKVNRSAQTLQALVAGDSTQTQRLSKVMASTNRLNVLCKRLRRRSASSGSAVEQMQLLKANLVTVRLILEEGINSGNVIREFREQELLASDAATSEVHRFALLIQVITAIAIVGSILLAYLLFRYFMNGIYSRVTSLTTNIDRLKNSEALVPVIAGTDELALMDEQFHEMANAVASAQRMKQAFVNAISDQLKTPIDQARVYLTRLTDGSLGPVSEQVATRAKRAERSLDRMLGLMNDLLILDSVEPARLEIKQDEVDVADVINASIDAVSAYAEKQHIRLERSDTSLTLFADADRIVQVLVNLLSNAIKFSSEGSSIKIDSLGIGSHVKITVSDQGRGIPVQFQDTIFDRFAQVSTEDSTQKGGTGLGLPICKEIVELHGGKIGVESVVGKGSTFWILLPALESIRK